MDPQLHPYVSHFKSALHRDDIFAQPVRMSRQLLELCKTNVPPQLTADHSAAHLLSFAGHVQSLIDKPCESLSFEGRKLYNVLGMLVLEKMPKGNFSALIWLKEPAWVGPGLQSFDPVLTPLLNFPTTNLWIQKFKATLAMEALSRIGDEERALVWAEWAWVYIELKVIRPINLDALRYAIRLGLELDSTTLRLVKLKRHYESIELITIGHYNEVQLEQSELLALEEQAPFLLPLWWGFRSVDFLPVFGEPVKRLKQSLIAIGGPPAQWRAIVNSGHIGINTYETLYKEFLVGNLHENLSQVISVLSTLGANRFPPIWFLRLVLSLVGTKAKPPLHYATELNAVYKPLRHVLRLIDDMQKQSKIPALQTQTHSILRWIWDQQIMVLDRKQRQGGWTYLLDRATEYAQDKQSLLSVENLYWQSPIPELKIAEQLVVPLTTGKALWDEAVGMKHCADLYAELCLKGQWLLFSVRDLTGKRKATISYKKIDEEWKFVQVCGTANRQASESIMEVVKILNGLINIQIKSPDNSAYEVYVNEMWDPGQPWLYGVYKTAERAIAAAKSVCDAELESRDLRGFMQWCTFGDSAFISSVDQAPDIDFSGHTYMEQLCGIRVSTENQHNTKESI
jgi:hypothetical protein